MSKPSVLAVALTAAAAGAIGAWALLSQISEVDLPAPTELVAPPQSDGYIGARTRGSPEAPVTIYEASDFQCPFCKIFVDSTLPHLEAEYVATGKVKLIFVNFPLAQIHRNAPAAHEFAMCAAKQDLFWPVHDLLFRYQEAWEDLPQPGNYFRQLGDSAGLSLQDLEACFASGEVRFIVQNETQAVFSSGISSTPTFIIEGGILGGAHPIELWRPILDSLVAARTEG